MWPRLRLHEPPRISPPLVAQGSFIAKGSAVQRGRRTFWLGNFCPAPTCRPSKPALGLEPRTTGIQPVKHGRVRPVGQVSAKTRHHHANKWMRDSAHLVAHHGGRRHQVQWRAHHGGRRHQVQWRVVRHVDEDDLTWIKIWVPTFFVPGY